MMSDRFLFGIAGPARSGKDTVASYFERVGFVVTHFADPIKDGLAAMFNLSHDQLNGSLKDSTLDWLPLSPRQLLQTLGTEWGRGMVCPDVWLRLAEQFVNHYLDGETGYDGVVFADVRFDDEADWIRSQGGVVLHVVRDAAPAVADHVSEQGVARLPQDWVFYNNDSISGLYLRLNDRLIEHAGSSVAVVPEEIKVQAV